LKPVVPGCGIAVSTAARARRAVTCHVMQKEGVAALSALTLSCGIALGLPATSLSDTYYPVGPGRGSLVNNIAGVYLSNSRATCPPGTTPDQQ